MSKNQNSNDSESIIIDSDSHGPAELRTPSEGEATFTPAMSGDSAMHDRIMARAEELDLPTSIIDLPSMFSLQTDDAGDKYVQDMNNVIRYYVGTGELVVTKDFMQNAMVVDSNERTNTFERVYGLR